MKQAGTWLAGILLLAAAAAPSAAQDRPAQLAQAAPAGGPLATAEYSDDPVLHCDLLEAKRVSGGALLVRWRLANTAGQGSAGLVATQPKSVYYGFDWKQLYYIDPAQNKKYQVLTDSEDHPILQGENSNIAAGQQRAFWAKFPAPPPGSTKISISIPKFPPFEDVAIGQ